MNLSTVHPFIPFPPFFHLSFRHAFLPSSEPSFHPSLPASGSIPPPHHFGPGVPWSDSRAAAVRSVEEEKGRCGGQRGPVHASVRLSLTPTPFPRAAP
eukprot:752813-Rhodomonas_salina.1